jgi:predicted DNA binding protein
MAVIVEIHLTSRDLPLVELAGSIPSNEISIENAMVLENKRYFLLATIAADSDGAFEDVVDDQDEIIDWKPVGQTRDRWFYQLLLDDFPSLYDVYDPSQVDVVSIETTVTDEGGIQRLLFSDYDEFGKFQRRCERADIPFKLLNISSNPEDVESASQSGLTDRQYEALTVAFTRGYYDSPRRASTREIAEELGISAPAVSKLLQRAERKLVGQAIGPEHRIKEVN